MIQLILQLLFHFKLNVYSQKYRPKLNLERVPGFSPALNLTLVLGGGGLSEIIKALLLIFLTPERWLNGSKIYHQHRLMRIITYD